MEALGIYIHIPVCNQKCDYCDFYSIPYSDINNEVNSTDHLHKNSRDNLNFWNQYADKLEIDLQFKAKQLKRKVFLYSIFFGGGSPSLVPPKILHRIINGIKSFFPHKTSQVEITLEVNPEDISITFINEIYDAGVNRVSMGLQSLNEEDLKYLGREGSVECNFKALDILNASKIKNTNADVIYGITGQKWKNIEYTIHTAINSGV